MDLNNQWTLHRLKEGIYKWSVQAVDPGYAASSFTSSETFEIAVASPPILQDPELFAINIDSIYNFTWYTVENAVKYHLQLSIDSLFTDVPFSFSNITDTNFLLEGMAFNTCYYWRVKAKNNNGWGDWSESFRFRTKFPYIAVETSILEIGMGHAIWGDSDNDNDLDLYVSGEEKDDDPPSPCYSRLYINDANNFIETYTGTPGLRFSAFSWVDYDLDNDLDFVITGDDQIWDNEHYGSYFRKDLVSYFQVFDNKVPDVAYGSTDLGDFDRDGDVDLLMTGVIEDNNVPVTKIILNEYPTMSNFTQEFPGVYYSDAKWGDLDNDGDLDFILAGKVSSNEDITSVYINNLDSFSLYLSEIPSIQILRNSPLRL